MKTTNTAAAPTLRAACYEIAMAKDVPDAGVLDEVVRRYPQYGAELTEFAISLALDALRDRAAVLPQKADEEENDSVSPSVSRALSRFHNHLNSPRTKASAPAPSKSAAAEAINPFAGLSRAEFRALAARLDTTSLFLVKLRDRQINPETVTPGFRSRVAKDMNVSLDVMSAHFDAARGGASRAAQFHKAEGKPTGGGLQTFDEAVRTSGMTEEQQRALLDL